MPDGARLPVAEVVVPASNLLRLRPAPVPAPRNADADYDRQSRLFGVAGQAVLGEMRVLHQRQRLVQRVYEPAFGGRENDVEKADDIACHGVSWNPVQRDPGDIEVNLAGLDLYRARIDLLFEAVRSQHASGV